MKTSELIEEAKWHLWDGKCEYDLENGGITEYICFAILYAARTHRCIDLHQQCRDVIEARLFPWNNLDAWLQHGIGIPAKELTAERVQKHRRKWMNKLIKEYKAKGD